jgi:hypothetical protein
MKVKLFEIRDHATMIPAIAISMDVDDSINDTERWLLRKAGYGSTRCILLTRLGGGHSSYDPYGWPNRTMRGAHFLIDSNWDSLESGAVIDARVGLEETRTAVESERGES